MLELILIDLALCAVLIMVASVMVMRRRRGSDQPRIPVREWRGAVAGLADEGMAQPEMAVVPGFSHDTVQRDPGARVPAEPDEQQAAAGAVTSSERIASYYDEADQPMSDYLAARGWTEEPGPHDPG
jgi:hypothetical protein